MKLKIKNFGVVVLSISTVIPILTVFSLVKAPKVFADPTVLINSPTTNQEISSHDFSASGNMMVSPYANVKLDIFLDGVQNQVVTTDGSGNWTANFTGVADGLHSVSAKLRKLRIAAIVNGSNNDVQLYETEDDLLSQTITSDNLSGVTARMALKPDGTELWIPILDSKIQIYNNANRVISQTISVDGMPIQIVFNTAGTKAYAVTNTSGPKIIEIDTATYTVTHEISLAENVNRMVISPDGSKIYLLNDITANVTVVNTSTRAISDTFGLGDGVLVTTMAINSDGTIMYVLYDSPAMISSFNTSDFSEISNDTITSSGLDMVLNSANTNLYFIDNTYKFYNLPVADGVFTIGDAHTSNMPALTSVGSIFLTEDEDKVYITDPTNDSMEWLDALSNSPTPTVVSDVLLNANTFGIAIPDLTTPQTLTTVNFKVVTGADITPPSDPGTPHTTGPTSNRRPTWTWTPSTDAFGIKWYSYDLAGDPAFAGLFETGAVGGNSFTPANDLPDGTWYFRIMAWDNNNNHTSYFPDSGTVVFTATYDYPAASSTTNNIRIKYSFPQTVQAGSKKIIFTPTSFVGSDKTMTLNDNNTQDFTFGVHDDPLGYPNIDAADFSGLTDGTYTVKLQYTDVAGYTKTISHTNVKFDGVTQAPTLISPVDSTSYQDFLPIQFIIPETPLSGTLKVTLVNTGTSQSYVLTLETTGLTTNVAQGFTLDTLNLIDSHITNISPAVTYLPHGNYSVTLSYRDALGNAISNIGVANAAIGFAGPHIRFTAPTTSSTTTITDTQISIVSEVNVLAADVSVDNSSTASYSDLICTQTNSKKVDCTVKITSTGNFVLKATDANATNTKTQAYTITVPDNSNNQNNNNQSEGNNQNTDSTPASSPVKTVVPVAATTSLPVSQPVSNLTTTTSSNSDTSVEEQNFPLWIFIPVILGIGGIFIFIKRKGNSESYN